MTHETVERLFPGVRFSHAVSLGGNCEAAHGLRVCGRHSVNGLFDWLVTPLEAIIAILADDGARLGADLVTVHDGTSVRCGAYGVLYHHEFPRDADYRVIYTPEAIADCKAKLSHKMATFLGLRERGPVLFVRCGLETDLAWDRFAKGGSSATATDIDALAAALARRLPGLDFRLLAVVVGEPEVLANLAGPRDPRVLVTTLPRHRRGAWSVADQSWRELLARVEFADTASRANQDVEEGLYWFGGDDVDDTATPEPPAETSGADRKATMDDALLRGDDAAAIDILTTLVNGGYEPPDLAWKIGLDLWHGGRSPWAVHAFAVAYLKGFRAPFFLRDYLDLLTGEMHYAEVLRLVDQLRGEWIGARQARAARHLAMLSGHAKLALARPRDTAIGLACTREASATWLDTAALLQTLAAAIRERRPFAFIRVGDGEARYLIAATHSGDDPITAEEAHAMGDVCWENWFGEPLSAAGDLPRTTLLAAYERAIRDADVVGACNATRLRGDTGHYGYLAWQEDWLRDRLTDRVGLRWADAQAHRHLNAQTPFLGELLRGQEVLGVISPHPGLADALKTHLGIGRVIGHVVPAEGRLPTAAASRANGKHFPAVFETLLADLFVPRPGCVFLVAAGLLGKIYCARIKALGGIALDIGALADAWMGYDTRDGQNADIATLSVATTPAELTPDVPAKHATTYGCLSFSKTGSMALADALRGAGYPETVHLHFLGPRALEAKRADPEPMLDLACEVAGRIDDPGHRFRFVTSVREPIGRLLSQAFYRAGGLRESPEADVVLDRGAIIDWWDRSPMARPGLWSAWFDDTFKTTFGFDFREHPFDHNRKSIRFSSEKLRLLVLRLEDKPSLREAELGWLVDSPSVTIRTINDATHHGYADTYQAFLRKFVAPSEWLDTFYDTDLMRHFYTQAERDAFRLRWCGSKISPVRMPDAPPRKVACLSVMKTSSTALAAALSDTGVGEVAHIHHLGPRSRGRKTRKGAETDAFAEHLDDPTSRFAIVTCVRDPIARWISCAFHREIEFLAQTGKGIVDSRDDFIEWVEAREREEASSEWFDDALKATFDFDYRNHPFHFGRRSLRFASDRLRLVVVRQEDPTTLKEAELGWLIERDRIAIPVVNDSKEKFGDRYYAFVDSFVAPSSWLDSFYTTEVAKHFYMPAEREAFRARWSRSRNAKASQIITGSAPAAASRAVAPATPSQLPIATTANSDAVSELETLKSRIRDDYVVDFNDYAYRPRERDWSAGRGVAALKRRLDAAKDEHSALLERFCEFNEFFRAIPVLANEDLPYWENWWLPGLDAVALYGLVATLKPRTYLEVGAGHSTRFVRRAIADHQLATRIIAVDPNPTTRIDALCDEIVRSTCEDASLSLFAELRAGDMLFFDGSHRSFQNSDATVFFTEILPALTPGVVYGLHDIFLPLDYPESWLSRFYNEQYLLMAYLLGGAAGDQIIFPAHYVSRQTAFAHLRNSLFVGTRHLDWLVSSFWMRRATSF